MGLWGRMVWTMFAELFAGPVARGLLYLLAVLAGEVLRLEQFQ